MRGRRRAVLAALAILVSWVFAGGSGARDLVRETFEGVPQAAGAGVVPGREGNGWTQSDPSFDLKDPPYLDYAVSPGSARRGALSFDLQRKPGDIPNERSIFALQDAQGENLLLVQIAWNPPNGPGRPVIYLNGGRYYRNGLDLWSPRIVLDRDVSPGQWIRVEFQWDDDAKRYDLLVDGRAQDARSPGTVTDEKGLKTRDGRIGGNEARAKDGHQPEYFKNPFQRLLADVKRVRLGINYTPGKETGSSPLANAVLDNFAFTVEEAPPPGARPVIRSVSDDTFKVPGISGKLVAGDKVNVELVATPGGKASYDMGRVKGIPMEEVPPQAAAPGIPAIDNGTYRGSYTIKPGDDWENGQVVGQFVTADNVAAEPVTSASKWTIETKPRVTFSMDKKDLPADSSTKTRIKLVAKDANGNPLKGRRLKLTLATTDQYTGTVGAGDFGKQVGGSVETRWRGETDAFGEVEFDYTAGFAAKTVILSAKDLDSGGVTVDYITAYKEASIDIALKKVVSRAAVRRSVQYVLKVEASRTELTADGRSRSVIRATLLDPNGTTVPGDPVAFTLSSPNGTLRTIQGTTDSSGVATAEYTAGKKIGIVVITATATLRNAQGQVSIILLADAPAKVLLAAKPDNLPADGVSRADIQVKVTDINDNPNKDTRVEFRVAKGGGKLDYPDRTTDRFGDAANRYTAGSEAGIATILATVRSAIPSDAELAKARNVLFVPHNPESDQIRVERWLKRKGDSFVKDEPLVEYTVGRQKTLNVLAAPYDGTMREVLVEYWDNAEVGQTLSVLEPAKK